MATKNITEIEIRKHPVDILNENLNQALSVSYLLGEQFNDPESRFSDEILSNAVWLIQELLKGAVEALNKTK